VPLASAIVLTREVGAAVTPGEGVLTGVVELLVAELAATGLVTAFETGAGLAGDWAATGVKALAGTDGSLRGKSPPQLPARSNAAIKKAEQ
jgi:hypothetical protein